MKHFKFLWGVLLILVSFATANAQLINLSWVSSGTSMEYNSPTLKIIVKVQCLSLTPVGQAKKCFLGYYLSTDQTINTGDIRIDRSRLPELKSGQSTTEGTTVDISAYPGTWYVGFIIDYKDEVDEYNENDNSYCWSNPITYAALPNLAPVPDSCSFYFDDPYITCKIQVINNGSAPTTKNSPLQFYLSEDKHIAHGEDYPIWPAQLGNSPLAPGEYENDELSSCSVLWAERLPDGWGTYYVGYVIDFIDMIPESNENDNTYCFDSPITFYGERLPDLISWWVWNPDYFHFNEPDLLIEYISTYNKGFIEADSSIAAFYLSLDDTIKSSDYRIGEHAVEKHKGYSEKFIFSVDLHQVQSTPPLPAGKQTYYVGMIADDLNEIKEIDERNNAYCWRGFPITFNRSELKPNLTSDPNYCRYEYNEPNLSIYVRVINNGNGTAGPSHLGYFLSADTIITSGDRNIGESAVTQIRTDGYCDVRIENINLATLNLTANKAYYIGYIVDYQNEVAESNEQDNADYFNTPIQISGEMKKHYVATKLTPQINVPTIDGILNDAAWTFANAPESLLVGGKPYDWNIPWTNFTDNLIQWRAVWSAATNMLYVAIEVQDDIAGACDDDVLNLQNDDCIQLFVDGDSSGGNSFNNYIDSQIWSIRRDNLIHLSYFPQSAQYPDSIIATVLQSGNGGNWVLEVATPVYAQYATEQKILNIGDVIGWEIWYNDSDNQVLVNGKYVQEHQVGWGYTGLAWFMADYFQELEFGPSAGENNLYKIAFIHADHATLDLANSYKTLLDANNCPATIINNSAIAATDFSQYDLILLEPHWFGQWVNAQSDIDKLNNSGKPILGLGRGGGRFFGFLNLEIGRLHYAEGSQTNIYVVDPSQSLYSTPTPITIPGNQILQLYTTATNVWVTGQSWDTDITLIGRDADNQNNYSIIQQAQRYVLWGYNNSPQDMTQIGKDLFVNLINYMIATGSAFQNMTLNKENQDVDFEKSLPTQYELSQNYPNPFNPETTIAYNLPQRSEVRLDIYDLQGKIVRTLVQTMQSAGRHTIQWNGRNALGQAVASGMYFYRLEVKAVDGEQASFTDFKKMILMK